MKVMAVLIVFLNSRASRHWYTIVSTWFYHHEKMCQVHSWSWYDLELRPKGQIYRVNDMALCSGHRFFCPLTWSYSVWNVSVLPWYNVSRRFMNSVWPSPLTSISKLCFHNKFESSKRFLLYDIGIPNFGIWVYHHEICCVHSWP